MTGNASEPNAGCMQVFLTASATLREQVALSFRKLQAACLDAEGAARIAAAAAAAADMHMLQNEPAAAFPLFLSTKKYLQLLDGTLAAPFFPRCDHADSCMVQHIACARRLLSSAGYLV